MIEHEGWVELDEEEGKALFDRQCRKYAGLSGEEWLRRYDAGAFRDTCGCSTTARLAMLIPFARPVPVPP